MNADDIKKEFIQFMESMHDVLFFPKNYFGCMMAVFVEQKPTTQERIEKLTGYSRATISQMLKLIQINFQLKKIKEPKIRKKFYAFTNPPRIFMLSFFEMIINTYQDKVDFLLPLIDELKPYTKKHSRFLNLRNFLMKFHEMSLIYLQLFSDTREDLQVMIKKGQKKDSFKQDQEFLKKSENQKIIQDLIQPPSLPSSYSDKNDMSDELASKYTQMKDKFFRKFRENLAIGESQLMQARSIIGTEILLENRPITQAEIEQATDLTRSLISDALSLLLEWGMIRQIKIPGERKKHYVINLSWDSRLINRLRVSKKYAFEVKANISKLIENAEQLNKNEDNLSLLTFLQHIQHSYDQFGIYFELLELKFLKKRLEENPVGN